MEDGDEAPAGRLSTESVEERRARFDTDRDERWADDVGTGRWLLSCVMVALGILLLLFVVVTMTGLPVGEPWRRYPLADLRRVEQRINEQHADLAERGVRDPSFRASASPASIDWVRGRIRIDGAIHCGTGLDTAEDWEMVLPGHEIDPTGCDDFA